MKLSNEQVEWYGAMDLMFASKGWTFLVQGWTREHDSLADDIFFNAQNMGDLEKARERYRLLDELIKLPGAIEAQRQLILEDDGLNKNPYE